MENPEATGLEGDHLEEIAVHLTQIVAILKGHAAGAATKEICQRHRISLATFFIWKAKFGGMEVSDVAKMRAVEDENRRLKRIVADQALNIDALKIVASGNF